MIYFFLKTSVTAQTSFGRFLKFHSQINAHTDVLRAQAFSAKYTNTHKYCYQAAGRSLTNTHDIKTLHPLNPPAHIHRPVSAQPLFRGAKLKGKRQTRSARIRGV